MFQIFRNQIYNSYNNTEVINAQTILILMKIQINKYTYQCVEIFQKRSCFHLLNMHIAARAPMKLFFLVTL